MGRRAAGLLMLALLAGGATRAEPPALPAVWLAGLAGGLRGNYSPVEGRSIAWRLAWNDAADGGRSGEIVATGPGFALRVALEFSAAERRLRWRVTEGRADAGEWLPALAARFGGAEFAGLSAAGELVVAGEGEWSEGGEPWGTVRAAWRDGGLADAAQGWALAGVSAEAGGELSELLAGRVPLALGVGTITTGRFGARALSARAALAGDRVEVRQAGVEIAGGRVVAAPFTVSLAAPSLGVNLTLERVGLQDIVQLAPETLAGARGKVNGAVRVNWSAADGVSLGEGRLEIDASETAEVRFRPAPGLLTGSLPAVVLKHYPGLAKIETGETPLIAARFDVSLSPGGDAEGRTARVLIEGGPADGTLKAPLVLAINVRGPLEPLMKLGSMSGGAK